MKPPVYRIFGKPGCVQVLLQVRHHETGKLIDPTELEPFRAKVAIKTPWCFDIRAGSKMLLIPEAARFMIRDGTVERIEEPPLIPWQEAEAAQKEPFRG